MDLVWPIISNKVQVQFDLLRKTKLLTCQYQTFYVSNFISSIQSLCSIRGMHSRSMILKSALPNWIRRCPDICPAVVGGPYPRRSFRLQEYSPFRDCWRKHRGNLSIIAFFSFFFSSFFVGTEFKGVLSRSTSTCKQEVQLCMCLSVFYGVTFHHLNRPQTCGRRCWKWTKRGMATLGGSWGQNTTCQPLHPSLCARVLTWLTHNGEWFFWCDNSGSIPHICRMYTYDAN